MTVSAQVHSHSPLAARLCGFVAIAAALIMTASSCASQNTRTAPFRGRPDTVAAGDLLGPFRGRVIDATTQRPVTDALVYATWTIEEGYGLSQPVGFREHLGNTDDEGRYQIPALRDIPGGGGARVSDFYLLIYKRGYVAYRSDRRFPDLGPRRDFAQINLQIELEPWRSEYSHAEHLRYVGGGPAVATLTAWESDLAVAELSGSGDGQAAIASAFLPPNAAIAANLLTDADIKAVTGFDGSFATGPLGDEPHTDVYSSQHFKAQQLPEGYDVAVRAWQFSGDRLLAHYGQLRDSLPGVSETNELGDRSLRAFEGNIFGVAFVDQTRGLVVLITCGQSQCASADVAVGLGRAALKRAASLPPRTN